MLLILQQHLHCSVTADRCHLLLQESGTSGSGSGGGAQQPGDALVQLLDDGHQAPERRPNDEKKLQLLLLLYSVNFGFKEAVKKYVKRRVASHAAPSFHVYL